MRRPSVQWFLAIIVTLASAVRQRTTGPTHPARGTVQLGGQEIGYRLQRSHSITGRPPIAVTVPDPAVVGVVEWRRFPTSDPWRREPMVRQGDALETVLPPAPEALMPMAGKLEYRMQLTRGTEQVAFPRKPAATRFKGDVPVWVLIPHIAAMSFGMTFAIRAALTALGGGNMRRWGFVTAALLVFAIPHHRVWGSQVM